MSAASSTAKYQTNCINFPAINILHEKWKEFHKGILITTYGQQILAWYSKHGVYKSIQEFRDIFNQTRTAQGWQIVKSEEFDRIEKVLLSCFPAFESKITSERDAKTHDSVKVQEPRAVVPKVGFQISQKPHVFPKLVSMGPLDTFMVETPSEEDLLKSLSANKPQASKLEFYTLMSLSETLSSTILGNNNLKTLLKKAIQPTEYKYLTEQEITIEMEWIMPVLTANKAKMSCYPSATTILKIVGNLKSTVNLNDIHIQILESIARQVAGKFFHSREALQEYGSKFYVQYNGTILQFYQELAEDICKVAQSIEASKKKA
jgi:hypothetical protein